MLKGNLQPTDFADSEVRVSSWRDFPHHGNTAYRVWICRAGAWWFQRHEWSKVDRNSTETDAWILQGHYPRRQFDAHMMPATVESD